MADDLAILAQQEAIEREIKESSALVSDYVSLEELKTEYVGNERFLTGIDHLLSLEYRFLKRIRGDGNCFYRAFLYRYLQNMKGNIDERKRILQVIETSKQELAAVGYTELTIEPFYDAFLEYLTDLNESTDVDAYFTTEDSNYLVWYMRLLTAGYLKRFPDRFQPFLPNFEQSISDFCKREVEPMGKECEQIQIIALTESLQIGVKIHYLDGIQPPSCFNDETQVTLLYRPGHYDLLYLDRNV